MNHISLFSGIGGFELAAEWAGWNNIASCEINPFGRKVLEYYWPNAYHHDDIRTLTKEILDEKTDWKSDELILTGGFPCQPYSVAGKRLGKDDERHLWPEMLRIIRELSPKWVVGENVFGLVNWNDGVVFNEVQTDLEAAGYEVQAFIFPACAVNAPHRRDRVWFVAHSNNPRGCKGLGQVSIPDGKVSERHENAEPCDAGSGTTANTEPSRSECESWFSRIQSKTVGQSKQAKTFSTFSKNRTTANAASKGLERDERGSSEGKRFISNCQQDATNADLERQQERDIARQSGGETRRFSTAFSPPENWEVFPTQSPVCDGDDGLSARLDGITFSKWRNESIKAGGNAIVPQVVYQIFKAINKY